MNKKFKCLELIDEKIFTYLLLNKHYHQPNQVLFYTIIQKKLKRISRLDEFSIISKICSTRQYFLQNNRKPEISATPPSRTRGASLNFSILL